jgi:hypothetical protein
LKNLHERSLCVSLVGGIPAGSFYLLSACSTQARGATTE